MAWTLEHIPASAPESAVTKTLLEWGISSAQLQFVNWGIDSLSITIALAASLRDAVPLWSYRDTLVLRRDGVIVFRGTVTAWPMNGSPEADGFHYTAQGAGWWLQFYPFTWYMYPEDETVADPANRRAWRWLNYALQSAIDGGAPIAVDAGGLSFSALTAPCPDLRSSANAAEVVARVASLHPLSAGWWDYSGATPIARSSARAGLAAYTLDLADYAVGSFGLTPRPDLQLFSVRIGYRYPNPTPDWTDVVDYESAGPDATTRGPNRLHVMIDVEDLQSSADARSFGVAAIIYNGLKDLVWSGSIPLTEVGTPLPLLRPGYALSIAGGRAEWESMATVIQSITYSLTPEQPDTMVIGLGAPEHLGPQDFLEFARAGGLSAGAGGGNPSPWDPPPPPPIPPGDTPGTYSDLNGGTGGGTPGGSIAVEARGGSWSLCGFAPYEGGALIRYKTKNLSGSAARGSSWVMALSGATTYNPATACSQSTTGQIVRSGFQLDWDCGVAAGTFPVGDLPGDACLPSSQVVSPTRRIIPSTAKVASTMAAVLADPDTPDSAIARLLASEPAWASGTTGIRTIPTSGVSGIYRELRYRTEHTEGSGESAVTLPTLTGLSPWWRYLVTVSIERRPVNESGAATGDGSWSPAGARTHYLLADLAGEAGIDWQVIEPEAGYEVRVASTLVEVAP